MSCYFSFVNSFVLHTILNIRHFISLLLLLFLLFDKKTSWKYFDVFLIYLMSASLETAPLSNRLLSLMTQNSSVIITKKMNLKTGVSRKQSTPNFPKNKHLVTLIRTRRRAYQGVRITCFSENLACFVFLKHPFRDWPCCPITYDIDKTLCGSNQIHIMNERIRKI